MEPVTGLLWLEVAGDEPFVFCQSDAERPFTERQWVSFQQMALDRVRYNHGTSDPDMLTWWIETEGDQRWT
jgi:hypothetical protein